MGARADGRRGTGDVPRAGAGGAFSSHGRLGVGRADAGMAVRGGVKLRGLKGRACEGPLGWRARRLAREALGCARAAQAGGSRGFCRGA